MTIANAGSYQDISYDVKQALTGYLERVPHGFNDLSPGTHAMALRVPDNDEAVDTAKIRTILWIPENFADIHFNLTSRRNVLSRKMNRKDI